MGLAQHQDKEYQSVNMHYFNLIAADVRAF